MRLTDNNNVSNVITDRNFVSMEYIGVEVQTCDCFQQIFNKFELTTSFFGKDSDEVARATGTNSAYLHIRDAYFQPMSGVKCTLYNIESVKCVGEKIKLELTATNNNLLLEEDLKNIADKISSTRFRFVRTTFVNGISFNLNMIHVKD